MHRVDLKWTDSDLEYVCRWYEVCHPNLDFIIEEALSCCSKSASTIDELEADPGIAAWTCLRALTDAGGNCKKCTGLYILGALGTGKRWLKGYKEVGSNATPTAERLVDIYKTGVCRDYSLVAATLLRKAGYTQDEIFNMCDGAHCYNLVKLPGDQKYHVADTTGNYHDIKLGGLPSTYPYCNALTEANYCFEVKNNSNPSQTYYTGLIPDVNAYWNTVNNKLQYIYPPKSCVGSQYIKWGHYPQCGPGPACGQDNFRIPSYAPPISKVVGCS
jgi:hypothetical protein